MILIIILSRDCAAKHIIKYRKQFKNSYIVCDVVLFYLRKNENYIIEKYQYLMLHWRKKAGANGEIPFINIRQHKR